MAGFNDLVQQAVKFVEKQKGVWEHSEWTAFISDIQKKSGDLTKEMQDYLGLVTESIRKFYSSQTLGKDISENISSSVEKAVSSISEQTTKFIEQTKGVWDHAGWENFLNDIQKKGIQITEDTKSYIGDILESTKKFYASLPLVSTKAPSVSESKPMEKAKTTKAKPKTTTKKRTTEKKTSK